MGTKMITISGVLGVGLLTYSINFAAMIIAAAGQIEIWTKKGDDDHGKAIQGTIIFFVVPLFLVLFNSFGVQIYGLTEVIGGSLKLLGAVIIIICMIAINVKDGLGTTNYEGDMFPYHKEVAGNWAEAFFVCLSIAAFAYIGVEITAATALEARLDKKPRSGEEAASHATKGPWPAVSVQFSATWTSFIAWVIYFLGSLMMTLNVKWDDINLPRAGWLGSPGKDEGTLNTDSGFARAFLSAYLAPICFIPLWLLIKTYRSHGWKNIKWELEDLSNLAEVKNKIQRLDEIRQRATARDDIVQKPGWGNLWGLM
ncbi:hypothetical protein ATERTT37_007837 [Aspergillus terreus]